MKMSTSQGPEIERHLEHLNPQKLISNPRRNEWINILSIAECNFGTLQAYGAEDRYLAQWQQHHPQMCFYKHVEQPQATTDIKKTYQELII